MELNKILHPDLLPEEDLHQILESLSVKIPANLPKPELLEIFKKVAVPLPQRNEESKSQRKVKQNDISAVIDLNELSLSNNENDDELTSYYSKKMKLDSQNDEKKRENDLMFQLEKDCEKMIVDVENINVSNPINRKVALKRSHLFQKDYDNLIKRTRNFEKLTIL